MDCLIIEKKIYGLSSTTTVFSEMYLYGRKHSSTFHNQSSFIATFCRADNIKHILKYHQTNKTKIFLIVALRCSQQQVSSAYRNKNHS
jgi:hypothetical protein